MKLTRREATELALVALPFVAVIVLFHGLRDTFPTFHGTDEFTSHIPTIQAFAHQLPAPDLRDYRSATGPLFHLVFAVITRVIGFHLAALRLLDVGISLAAAYAFFRLVTRAGVESFHQRVLLTALFACSPYFFGASFILLTDNLGLLFAILALEQLLRTDSADLGPWIAFAALACAAMLTRQLYAWLPVVAALVAVTRPLSWNRRFTIAGLLALSCVPLALLVHSWGGLVPPLFQAEHASAGFNPRCVVFALAVIGLYGVALDLGGAVTSLTTRSRTRTIALAAAALTLVALFAIPTHAGPGDDGILWRVSHAAPVLAGTSLVFWLLAPVGSYVIAFGLASGNACARLASWSMLVFIAANSPNDAIFQKYFDPQILILAALSLGGRATSRITVATRVVLLAVFLLYPLASWKLTQG